MGEPRVKRTELGSRPRRGTADVTLAEGAWPPPPPSPPAAPRVCAHRRVAGGGAPQQHTTTHQSAPVPAGVVPVHDPFTDAASPLPTDGGVA